MADELGPDPGPQVRELEQRILRQDPAITVPRPGVHPWAAGPCPAVRCRCARSRSNSLLTGVVFSSGMARAAAVVQRRRNFRAHREQDAAKVDLDRPSKSSIETSRNPAAPGRPPIGRQFCRALGVCPPGSGPPPRTPRLPAVSCSTGAGQAGLTRCAYKGLRGRSLPECTFRAERTRNSNARCWPQQPSRGGRTGPAR
jgi:hypothetical protein